MTGVVWSSGSTALDDTLMHYCKALDRNDILPVGDLDEHVSLIQACA